MLDRKLALITGASSGIGRESSKLAAADGYDLILAADNPLRSIHGPKRPVRNRPVQL